MDRRAATEKAKQLVSGMTPEEKISQLCFEADAIDRLGIPRYNWWNEALHGVARNGTATVFPQAIGLAAMFDVERMGKIARAVGMEGRAKHNAAKARGDRGRYKGLTFWSPNVNIFRDPRWGRGHETYGEDPHLTAATGVAFVKGLQGEGDTYLAAACAKHFCVHSGPEKDRHGFDARVCEKDMYETYLPAFEALVKEAKAEAVMGCYNRVNGEPACGSYALLTDLLRGKWGFQGHVVSDCGAIMDIHMHHKVTDTVEESAALALKAGCDINCGGAYRHLITAYRDGLVSDDDLTRAAVRALTARYLLGTLGDTECAFDDIPFEVNDCDEHAALAKEAALASMVLLKNDGILPLDLEKIASVAVIGPNADSKTVLEGNYNGTSSRYTTFLEGIRSVCEGRARVFFAEGCHLYKDFSSDSGEKDDRLSEAVAASEVADVTVLCLGLDPCLEGEEGDPSNLFAAGDKADLELPMPQRRLLDALIRAGKPLVVLNASGSAVRIEGGNAILQTWYPGQAGGSAAADILFGRYNPSGRLPVTFYKSVRELPDFSDYSMENRTYRYFKGDALYPFGYGMSYTAFAFSDARFRNGELVVTVKNAGEMDGEVPVQVYIRAENAKHAPRFAALCAFRKVLLRKGEEKTVCIPIDRRAFTVVNDAGERVSEGDFYTLYVSDVQPDARTQALTGKKALSLTVKGYSEE